MIYDNALAATESSCSGEIAGSRGLPRASSSVADPFKIQFSELQNDHLILHHITNVKLSPS